MASIVYIQGVDTLDIYALDKVYCLVLTDKYRVESRIIHKVQDERYYIDSSLRDYLISAEYGHTWFATEMEATKAANKYNRILKSMNY